MRIVIDVALQILDVYEQNTVVRHYRISSARNGVGQEFGSFRTPLGKHIIRAIE